MNLILNARDAMTRGGRLEIITEVGENAVVVKFRDSGSGISPSISRRSTIHSSPRKRLDPERVWVWPSATASFRIMADGSLWIAGLVKVRALR
jgi:hypothetical protein